MKMKLFALVLSCLFLASCHRWESGYSSSSVSVAYSEGDFAGSYYQNSPVYYGSYGYYNNGVYFANEPYYYVPRLKICVAYIGGRYCRVNAPGFRPHHHYAPPPHRPGHSWNNCPPVRPPHPGHVSGGRPASPSWNRPSWDKPSHDRPSYGKPSHGRPSGDRPSWNHRPASSFPSVSTPTRPSKPGSIDRPGRPSRPDYADRPSRPSFPDRPAHGGSRPSRPSSGNMVVDAPSSGGGVSRPSRPSGGSRPDFGGIHSRPSGGDSLSAPSRNPGRHSRPGGMRPAKEPG